MALPDHETTNYSQLIVVTILSINSTKTGLEVDFSVNLQSLAGKIFSASKLVRSASSKFFPMFGRHG